MGQHQTFFVTSLLALCAALGGCSTESALVATGIGATTLVGGTSPSQEIQQIYYLGVFDPLEQLPPTVYRVRVHGQASGLSGMSFASGWVPAPLVDSLNTNITIDNQQDGQSTGINIQDADQGSKVTLNTGRRLIEFGPSGFRENPKDYRLVIVMGSDPAAYFKALNGVTALLNPTTRNTAAKRLQRLDDLESFDKQSKLAESASIKTLEPEPEPIPPPVPEPN